MNRIELLQYLIDKNGFSSYLEIGTYKGESFLPIKCRSKIAVDPYFQISKKKKLKWVWNNPSNLNNKYFQMTSDEFFKSHKKLLEKGVDLVFIDGLHTFRASLIDCLNFLRFLNRDGVIVLHDCFPPNAAAATPANSLADADTMNIPGWKKEWCGDVWKTIVYLRKVYPNKLDVYTLDCDYGLGVVRFIDSQINFEINEDLFDEISILKYEDLKKNLSDYLNLKDECFLEKQ